MSDFDREAERERLREKYEEEQADREVTQQMSELLLQGATMTNRHCEECGNPIFRYDGQEFCPICHTEAGQSSGDAQDGVDSRAAGDVSGAEGSQVADAGDDLAWAAGTGAQDRAVGGTDADDVGSRETAAGEQPQSQGADQAPSASTAAAQQHAGQGGGDLATARASLVRSVNQLAARAEQAEDPRRAKDLLAAAREAAEALAALGRLG